MNVAVKLILCTYSLDVIGFFVALLGGKTRIEIFLILLYYKNILIDTCSIFFS
jgi:hypothetical protein